MFLEFLYFNSGRGHLLMKKLGAVSSSIVVIIQPANTNRVNLAGGTNFHEMSGVNSSLLLVACDKVNYDREG